jgi:hypothetical protein
MNFLVCILYGNAYPNLLNNLINSIRTAKRKLEPF